MKRPGLLAIILPGFLVAATGVGAGDLATASFSGSQLGVAILWAVVVGGILKFSLTEGLTRWQLVTGETFLEGVAHRFSPVIGWFFLPYLFLRIQLLCLFPLQIFLHNSFLAHYTLKKTSNLETTLPSF